MPGSRIGVSRLTHAFPPLTFADATQFCSFVGSTYADDEDVIAILRAKQIRGMPCPLLSSAIAGSRRKAG